MPNKCCISNCRLQWDDPGCLKLSFFQVPGNGDIRSEWSNIINKHFTEEVKLRKRSLVCAYHFEPSCFNFSGLCKIVRLKKGSCPTIFENYSSQDLEDNVNNSQTGIYKKTAIVLAESNNLQRINNVLTAENHSDTVTNTIAKLQDSDLEINSHLSPSNNLENLEEFSLIIEFQGNSYSDAADDLGDTIKVKITMQDVVNTIKELHTNKMNQSCTVKYSICSQISPKKNVDRNFINKSLANIDVDLIDYSDKIMLQRLLKKVQAEVIKLRRIRSIQHMRLYCIRKKIRNSTLLTDEIRQQLLYYKVEEI